MKFGPQNEQARFNKLLDAMVHGEPPSSAKKKPSSGQASDAAHDAYYSDIQTHQGILEGDDR